MKHFADNPRQITERQFSKLRETLARLGDLSGIVHDLNSDQIVGGNQRARALDLLGREPVIERRYDEPTETGTVAEGYFEIDGERFAYRAVRWDDAQCREANVTANIAGGNWDWDALASWDYGDLAGWGFDDETLHGWNDNAANLALMMEAEEEEPPEDPGAQVDQAEALREKWGVESGDLWVLGEHRILVGDSTLKDDVLVLFGGERPAMVATDPPFAITGSATGTEDMSGIEIIRPFFRLWMQCWFERLDDFSHIYVCCDWRTMPLIDTEGKKRGATPKNCIVWHKTDGGLGAFYQNSHEFVWFAVKQPPKRVQGNATGHRTINGQSNVWKMTPATYSGEVLHSANKPPELFERAITNSSDVGDIVGEPFLGAGACLIACERLGRKCRAVEIEAKYVAVALDRWATMTGKTPERVG